MSCSAPIYDKERCPKGEHDTRASAVPVPGKPRKWSLPCTVVCPDDDLTKPRRTNIMLDVLHALLPRPENNIHFHHRQHPWRRHTPIAEVLQNDQTSRHDASLPDAFNNVRSSSARTAAAPKIASHPSSGLEIYHTIFFALHRSASSAAALSCLCLRVSLRSFFFLPTMWY